MKQIVFPAVDDFVSDIKVGDVISISGIIFAGRDAVLPKIIKLYKENRLHEYGIDLKGSVIFHTAVSPAGVGPTSSNKLEIESSIPVLSEAGVRLHLGKGAISKETVESLDKYGSVFAVIPPVTALLEDHTVERELVAFPELGMEALWRLKVKDYQAIIAAAHGKSIY